MIWDGWVSTGPHSSERSMLWTLVSIPHRIATLRKEGNTENIPNFTRCILEQAYVNVTTQTTLPMVCTVSQFDSAGSEHTTVLCP